MAREGDVVHLDRLSQMPVRVLPVNVTMPPVLPINLNGKTESRQPRHLKRVFQQYRSQAEVKRGAFNVRFSSNTRHKPLNSIHSSVMSAFDGRESAFN